MPDHPMAMKDGYALEHRVVLYDAGIAIERGQHVDHRNGDKTDNRLENLRVLTPRQHIDFHIDRRGYIENQHGRFRPKMPKRCLTCGASFLPWKPTGKFCSRECANRRPR